jgi:hypothetical protein
MRLVFQKGLERKDATMQNSPSIILTHLNMHVEIMLIEVLLQFKYKAGTL